VWRGEGGDQWVCLGVRLCGKSLHYWNGSWSGFNSFLLSVVRDQTVTLPIKFNANYYW
jgi:hypothetical protein